MENEHEPSNEWLANAMEEDLIAAEQAYERQRELDDYRYWHPNES